MAFLLLKNSEPAGSLQSFISIVKKLYAQV